MSEKFTPPAIYEYLASRVLGQEDVLKRISVGIYKHIHGIKMGNILLIGNSGTGKTTIMKSIRQFYQDYPELADYRSMVVMNTNTLVDENGEVNLNRIFNSLEAEARQRLGEELDVDRLQASIEHATVCLDEVDKVSARIAAKVNVTGISIQQALLTVLEGEKVFFDTTVHENGQPRRIKIPIDTGNMLFVAGGAFEELYDQVYKLMENKGDERRLQEETRWNPHTERLEKFIAFNLRDYLKLSDLFTFGMVPQFIARFSGIAILEDLKKEHLKRILLEAADSPYLMSREFFRSFGIDLEIDDGALELIAAVAEQNTRIGARALREIFTRLLADLEFNPYQSTFYHPGPPPSVFIDRESIKRKLFS